jgi:hypothetical protein
MVGRDLMVEEDGRENYNIDNCLVNFSFAVKVVGFEIIVNRISHIMVNMLALCDRSWVRALYWSHQRL